MNTRQLRLASELWEISQDITRLETRLKAFQDLLVVRRQDYRNAETKLETEMKESTK